MTTPRPDTWMPLYVGDYLGDTMHLSGEEHGPYLLLIMAYWRNGGPLPADDKKLAAIARVTAKRWSEIKSVMAEFFTVDECLWHHGRVDLELAKAAENVEKQHKRTAAATAARTRNEQRNEQRNGDRDGERNDSRYDNVTFTTARALSPSPSPSPEISIEISKPRAARSGSEFEREFEETFWPRYPVREGKKPAKSAFCKARAKTPLGVIMAGLERYLARLAKPNAPSPKWAQGWLNDERWTDEMPVPLPSTAVVVDPRTQWCRRIEDWLERGLWIAPWGDPPDQRNCDAWHECPDLKAEFSDRIAAKLGRAA